MSDRKLEFIDVCKAIKNVVSPPGWKPEPYVAPEPFKNDTSPEALQKIRDAYPKECAKCDGPLAGPGTDEELIEQIEEHDGLFDCASLSTSETICDSCFNLICPGGKLLSPN